MKRFVLRLFISLKHITANVVDRNNGRTVATASTVEHALQDAFQCGRTCNSKEAAAVGEVLAMRLKTEGLHKESQKRGLKNSAKVWAIVNAMKNGGVELALDNHSDNDSSP